MGAIEVGKVEMPDTFFPGMAEKGLEFLPAEAGLVGFTVTEPAP